MKKTFFRAILLVLAVIFILQAGAFSVAAATDEEIAQYEHDLAVYNAWKTYREQEADYYAYQEYLTNGVHQHEAYLQYQSALADASQKLKNLDYIFITDSRGWALIESIEIGVSTVAQFAEDPENLEKYKVLIGDLSSVLGKANDASHALQSCFLAYQSIYDSTDLTTHNGLKARYAFYQSNYSALKANSLELYKDLRALYDADVIIRNALSQKEVNKGMEGRYLKLVAQLFVLYRCLDDTSTLDPSFKFGGSIQRDVSSLLDSSQIISDGNNANPSSLAFPAEAVSDVPTVEPVEKPTKPTEPEITVEPTKPSGYQPSGGGSSGGGGGTPSGGGGGGALPSEPEPVQEINRSDITEYEIKQNLAISYASTIKDGDAAAILSIESERALLGAGVKSVAISLIEEEEAGEGDRITFSASGGNLSGEAALFSLVLSDGENEDYRYAYFVKDGEEWTELSGKTADLSLSDEVLRYKSYYLRPSEEVDDENCNLNSLPISALPGEKVKIAPQCTFGYEIKNLVVRTKDGEEILVDHEEFFMPYGAVMISFEVVKILYHVQFFFDGVLIAERDYGLGEEIVPPEIESIPVKEPDEEYSYTFIGWSTEQKTAVGDERELKVEARFAQTPLNQNEELYHIRNVILKRILLVVVLLVAVAVGVFFLIRSGKKKKQATNSK